MTNFIEIADLGTDELMYVLDRADALQRLWQANQMPKSLSNQRIALWFFGNGFRNRMAFEIGARAMGAEVSFVPGDLGVHEPIEDVGRYLRNWFSMLVVRARNHADLTTLAAQVDIPVINARTNHNHPCEIVGDLQYIRQRRGTLDGLNVVFVGEASNLCRSWFEAAVQLPISVTQVAPQGYELNSELLKSMRTNAQGELSVSQDLAAQIGPNTDVIYTDCWPNEGDASEIRSLFLPYQIDTAVLGRMNESGFFLPCPPVTRGQEVTADAMNSHLCQDYAAKEYLLHAQNSIMEFLVHGR